MEKLARVTFGWTELSKPNSCKYFGSMSSSFFLFDTRFSYGKTEIILIWFLNYNIRIFDIGVILSEYILLNRPQASLHKIKMVLISSYNLDYIIIYLILIINCTASISLWKHYRVEAIHT